MSCGARLFRVSLLAGAAAAALPSQRLQLIDRVEAPIAYVRLERGAGERPAAADAVQRLLADPGLGALVARDGGALASAWGLVRGVLSRDCDEFELAVTTIVPGAGVPLLLVRVRLGAGEVARLQGLLDDGALASAHRALGSTRTYRLAGEGPARDAGPGRLVELALVGNDLIVGNDDLGMQEVLAPPPPQTNATPARAVLSADPAFLALRERLGLVPGSLFVYGDWQRLGHRLQQSLTGLPGALVEWSGLGGARRMLLSLSPGAAGFTASLLIGFDRADGADGARAAIDGWLAAAHGVEAKQLLAELPAGGFGGVVLAVDLGDLAGQSHRGEHALRALRHSFDDYGLDFDRHVLGRLGALGTVQLLLREGQDGADAEVVAIYAMRARSRAAAADLFTDLRRAAEAHGLGRLVPGRDRDRRAPDVIELRPLRGPGAEARDPICVAVVEDTVLVAFDAATLHRVHDDYRRAARTRGRRDAAAAAAVQRLAGTPVAGLFDIDLDSVFGRLRRAAGAPPADPAEPVLSPSDPAAVDLSGLPSRHFGYLALEPDTGQTVVRVGVLSSQ